MCASFSVSATLASTVTPTAAATIADAGTAIARKRLWRERQRQPRAGQEQQHDGHQPAGEPAQLAELEGAVLHALSGGRARASR